jgi:hypothetical protein
MINAREVSRGRFGPGALLFFAVALSAISFSLGAIIDPRSLGAQMIAGYIPLILGGLSMYLCAKSWKAAKHPRLILLSAVLLAPFAFGYPAWFLVAGISYALGRYHGPMP